MRISIIFKTLSLVALIVLSSCSAAKLSNGVSVYKRKYNKGRGINFSNNSFTESKISIPSEKKESKKIFIEMSNLSVPFVSNLNSNKTNFKNGIIKELMVSKLYSITNHSKLEDKCDVIILHNGDELSIKVEEINETQIKYRICNNQADLLYTINKSDVLLIRYLDGTKEVFASNENEKREEGARTVPTILGVIGTISGILIPLFGAILGCILGVIGLHMWHKKPEKYTKSGRGWSILAIIISTLAFVVYWIIIDALI